MNGASAINVHVVADDDFGAAAADAVLAGLPVELPRLGVATGATPLLLYRELGRRARCGGIDLRASVLVALDEYVGLAPADPRSYSAYVHTTIAGPLNVDADDVVVPDGSAADPDLEAAALEQAIAELGGVDVQITGIGANGHLGFNEPGSAFDSLTRTVALSDRTRHDNARFFGGRLDAVPTRAITQGLGTISRARAIVLLARGSHKADALCSALLGPVTTDLPASMLQGHPRVTVVADHAAAAHLP